MRYWFLIFAFLICATAQAQVVPGQALPQRDEKGCLLNVTATATGHWYTHKFGNKWLLVDPNGYACWQMGIFTFDPTISNINAALDTKYGDHKSHAIPAEIKRVINWGFNGLDAPTVFAYPAETDGTWPDSLQPIRTGLIWDVPLTTYSTRLGGYTCPDHNKDLFRGISYAATSGFVYIGGEDHDPYDPCFPLFLAGALVDSAVGGIFGGPPVDPVDAAASPYTIAFAIAEEDSAYLLTKPLHEHGGALVLASSPFQTWNDHWSVLYTVDRVYHAKQQFLTFIQGRYATIGALNTAWGSTYDAFASHTLNTVDACGTGNGATLTFSCTLSFVPDQDSVWLKVGATVVAGEYTNNGVTVAPAVLEGATISSGTVNHTSRAFTVTFTGGHAPGNGVAVTVDYQHAGWPKSVSGSAALMDEDGGSAWMPNSAANWVSLGNTTASFQADMNAFLLAYATQFFSVMHTQFKAVYPNSLLMGINVMDTQQQTNPPFRKEVLQAMVGNVDIIPMVYSFGVAGDQTRLDYIAQYAGDIPILDSFYVQANLDSGQTSFGAAGYPEVYQNDKGVNYAARMDFIYSGATSTAVAGSQPGLGSRVWQMWDDSTQGNWGLVSVKDNAMDGYESTAIPCIDPNGYTCGNESTLARSSYQIGTGTGAQTVFNATVKYLPIKPGTLGVFNGSFVATQQGTDALGRGDANPLSGSWTTTPSDSNLQLVSNKVESTSASGNAGAFYNGVTWSSFNDQGSKITIGGIGGSGELGSRVRWQSGSASGYQCRVNHPLGASTPVSIQRVDTNTPATISSAVINAAAGQTVECDALGSTIYMSVNGAQVLAGVDSTYSTGNAGMYIFDNSGAFAATTISAWTGYSLVATSLCSDSGSGTLSGASCSGTINNSTGAIAVTFGAAPGNGVILSVNFTANGWGGFQPSYIPSVMAEHAKVLHQIEAANFSPAAISSSTNLALYKPSASSSTATTASGNNYLSSRANDGDTATTWRPLASNPQWYRLDLVGLPSVSKIILRWGAVYATAYTLDWSDDGLSWTTAFTQAAGAGGVETDTFTAVSHRYWRGNFTARSGAGSLQLQEMEPYPQ